MRILRSLAILVILFVLAGQAQAVAGPARPFIAPSANTDVDPIPYDPPVAAKINVGASDGLGEAVVTGTAGATLPSANVLLVNLNSMHQAFTISAADGSFSTKIFAPPGSAILVKHGPESGRWQELEQGVSESLNPYPGTIIHVDMGSSTAQAQIPFVAVGGIETVVDDSSQTKNYVGAAWSMQGEMGPVVVDGEWSRIWDGNYQGEDIAGFYHGGRNWTHPALGDLDDDGDPDLLIGSSRGTLALYRNRGSGNSPAWQFETEQYAGISGEGWVYPTLADVNDDGALDLWVGHGDGRVELYLNGGSASVPKWSTSPDQTLNAGEDAAPTLTDLDADGDLDLLVGQSDGTLVQFKNSGSKTDPVWSKQTGAYGNISEPDSGLQPAAIDLDGDGDRDLLLGRGGDLVWYRNNGPPSNPSWTRMSDGYMGFGGSSAVSPAVGDWNGDGKEDLATGEHWGVLRFFANDTPPTWTEQAFELPLDLLGDSAPALGDWDDDGDLDMLIGQAHGDLRQYTNIGTKILPNWRPDGTLLSLPWTNHPHPYPALVDIDADDDLDLFIGAGDWDEVGGIGGIRFYRNDGTPTVPNWNLVEQQYAGVDVGDWSRPAFGDINDDGAPDLFVGAEDGRIFFVANTGTPSSPTWAALKDLFPGLDVGSFSAPALIDLDEDGDLDLLIGKEDRSLSYLRNTGTAAAAQWEHVADQYPGIDIGELATPTIGDLSGDGKPDLLLGSGDGGLQFYRYLSKGTATPGNDSYAPGDIAHIGGTLRIYSPAINAGTPLDDIHAGGHSELLMLINGDGQPLPAQNYFMSTVLTPSGLPIQSGRLSAAPVPGEIEIANWRRVGDNSIESDFSFTLQLPDDLPDGIYRPTINLDFQNVPTNTDWLAANVTQYTYAAHQAALAPITVGEPAQPRLNWRLLMDDFIQGTRGVGADQDEGTFEITSQIVTQGATFYVPRDDPSQVSPITYRLEPFLPMISFTDRRMPAPPLIPLQLPGGQLCVTVKQPGGTLRDLGCEAFAQSFNRTKTTRDGADLNVGTVQLDDVYSLMTAADRFRIQFTQYGRHEISMTGWIQDLWGNRYEGGGAYEVWVAEPLDYDPGILPATPIGAGDAIAPAIQFYPQVPADVTLTVTHYPDSDPTQKTTTTRSGKANAFGYFSTTGAPIRLAEPGEYRIDIAATHTAEDGTIFMAAGRWGNVVMTPSNQAQLVAHGRRGTDALESIPNHWFVSERDLATPAGSVPHSLNPYFNGDIFWSSPNDVDVGGDALIMGASVQDTVGLIESNIRARLDRSWPVMSPPGDEDERFDKGEIPLFISTQSGLPVQIVPENVDQMAYSYRSSQRPGVRVREVVAEGSESGGYWRFDTLYDDQLGVGLSGDLPNDYKFQYVGAVYRDLANDVSEYLGQGTGWVFIPDDDATGSRVMPPFAGPGNGGWTVEGGPILTLKGKDIHIFILPTGVHPGAVLEVGDRFHFAGHIMPTLPSQVDVTVTAPSGTAHQVQGQANSVGYFYDPTDDFTVDEAGLWRVDVRVRHDGQCSGGSTVSPYPSGDVLGSDDGRYWFYVVADNAQPLHVNSPTPGFLAFPNGIEPVEIEGSIASGLQNVTVDYTISMPGFILAHGNALITGNRYQLTYDPATLHTDFPNLDLMGRGGKSSNLSDTIVIGLLLRGTDTDGRPVVQANTITLQGEQVFVMNGTSSNPDTTTYLPLISK